MLKRWKFLLSLILAYCHTICFWMCALHTGWISAVFILLRSTCYAMTMMFAHKKTQCADSENKTLELSRQFKTSYTLGQRAPPPPPPTLSLASIRCGSGKQKKCALQILSSTVRPPPIYVFFFFILLCI